MKNKNLIKNVLIAVVIGIFFTAILGLGNPIIIGNKQDSIFNKMGFSGVAKQKDRMEERKSEIANWAESNGYTADNSLLVQLYGTEPKNGYSKYTDYNEKITLSIPDNLEEVMDSKDNYEKYWLLPNNEGTLIINTPQKYNKSIKKLKKTMEKKHNSSYSKILDEDTDIPIYHIIYSPENTNVVVYSISFIVDNLRYDIVLTLNKDICTDGTPYLNIIDYMVDSLKKVKTEYQSLYFYLLFIKFFKISIALSFSKEDILLDSLLIIAFNNSSLSAKIFPSQFDIFSGFTPFSGLLT